MSKKETSTKKINSTFAKGLSVNHSISTLGYATNNAPIVNDEIWSTITTYEKNKLLYKMGLNSTIASVLNLSASLLLTIKWQVKKQQNKEIPKNVMRLFKDILEDMDETWLSKVENIVSILQYGWCAFEIILKQRDDGKIGIKDLLFIPQWSIRKWETDKSGNMLGLIQEGNSYNQYKDIFIPKEKLLIITNTAGGSSIEGKSILIGAYQDWKTFELTEKSLRTTIKRSFVGIPIIRIPAEIIELAATTDNSQYPEEEVATARAVINSYKEIINNLQIGDDTGVILPSDTYRSENGGVSNVSAYDFSLLSLNGQPLVDINTVRVATEARMARVLQGDFLQMGTSGKTGTYSLGNTRYEMFARSINVLADKIVAEVNKHLFPLIARVNHINEKNIPYFSHTKTNNETLKNKIDAIAQYQFAGGTILPDENMDLAIREELEFPTDIKRPEGWLPEWKKEDTQNENEEQPINSSRPSPGKKVDDPKKRQRPTKK